MKLPTWEELLFCHIHGFETQIGSVGRAHLTEHQSNYICKTGVKKLIKIN